MYGGIRERNMVGPCRGEDDHPTTLFNTVIRKMVTEISVAFYKARGLEVRERGNTIMQDLAHPPDPELFQDINLPFDVANYAQLECRTPVASSQAVFQTLKRKEALEATGSDESDWKIIFNRAVETLEHRKRRK